MARITAIPGLSASGATRSAFIVLALALALALAGCGRRGALEAPPNAAAQAQAGESQRTGAVVGGDEEDDSNDSVVTSPIPGGQKKRAKGIAIPKRPFVLDPLL